MHDHLLHTVRLSNGQEVTVSTVDLTPYGGRYETALMIDTSASTGSAGSYVIEVIEEYRTAKDAAMGHYRHVKEHGGIISEVPRLGSPRDGSSGSGDG